MKFSIHRRKMDPELTEEDLLQKHRKQRKELQAEIQRKKQAVPKGDKKRKKETTQLIAQLEAELNQKQEEELNNLKQTTQPKSEIDHVSESLGDLSTEGNITQSSNEQNHVKKKSKAQIRREKKEQEAKERDERIKAGEIQNLKGPRHLEKQSFKSKLKERSLKLYEIPSDGDCLYAAVAHQLQNNSIKTSADSLRAQCAGYMREHRENFLPFLCHPDTGDMYTEDQFEVYCDKVQNTAEWGGHLEIQAMSDLLQFPIEVLQADGPSVKSGEQYTNPSLILSYHRHTYKLGEHYNSVIPSVEEENSEDELT